LYSEYNCIYLKLFRRSYHATPGTIVLIFYFLFRFIYCSIESMVELILSYRREYRERHIEYRVNIKSSL